MQRVEVRGQQRVNEIKNIIFISIFLLLMTFVMSGCNQKDIEGTYPPMISIENNIYTISPSGRTSSNLSLKYERTGEVQKTISMTEPMVKGENYYISNDLPVGTEIFRNIQDEKTLYAKHDNKYIKYELLED